MSDDYTLALLKTDLGLYTVTGPVENLLKSKLAAAENKLAKHGITIDTADGDDLDLLVMYAAWLYRKRAGSDPMPPMLRAAINDHKVTPAARTEDGA